MKKYPILILSFLLTSSVSFADFIQFGMPYYPYNDWAYRNSMNREINETINEMNRTNSWENPYASDDRGLISNFFKKKNNNDKYSRGKMDESDIEYLLSKMENKRFGQTYSNLDIDNRLDRLDSQMFGAIQSGDYKTRLNRLKHAFAAESSRSYKAKTSKLNNFKEMFSSGYPTSIPASSDYYSSLNGMFW